LPARPGPATIGGMGKIYEAIEGRLREFVEEQAVYFVATAPGGSDGHLNISPKGAKGTFAVIEPCRVAYLDYIGSGAETIAHLRENGRIVVMFCAFTGPPTIVRLHGRGRSVPPGDPAFEALITHFPEPRRHGLRSIVDVTVTRVSDSCGYGVPLMDHVGDRDLMERWAERRTDADLVNYAAKNNMHSIDGLPALAGTDAPGVDACGGVGSDGVDACGGVGSDGVDACGGVGSDSVDAGGGAAVAADPVGAPASAG
jgi:hypothetical protein